MLFFTKDSALDNLRFDLFFNWNFIINSALHLDRVIEDRLILDNFIFIISLQLNLFGSLFKLNLDSLF